MSDRPAIRKLGTIDCDLVEATPVVWQGRLLRFEYVRADYHANPTGQPHFRFVDVATGEAPPAFAPGYHLGSAFVERDLAHAYGVPSWGQDKIVGFHSPDLARWEEEIALELPGWGIYNTSVCRGEAGYVMAFEAGEPEELVGVRFTNFFAVSEDLRRWELLPPADFVYARDRYTACPCLRFLEGWYYLLYLEAVPAVPQPTGRTADHDFSEYLARSRDLREWELSPLNPVLRHSEEDRQIANPALTAEQRERVAGAVNRNNSDIDLCEYQGRTVIYYSWGSQEGCEHLAEAVFEGTLADFLRGFFPAR